MGWFPILLLVVTSIAVFAQAYRRHPDVLTGPWITKEALRHD